MIIASCSAKSKHGVRSRLRVGLTPVPREACCSTAVTATRDALLLMEKNPQRTSNGSSLLYTKRIEKQPSVKVGQGIRCDVKTSHTTATSHPQQIVPYRSCVFPPPPQPLLHLELPRLHAKLTGLASRGLLPRGSCIRCCLSLRPTFSQYLPPPSFSPGMRRARLCFWHHRWVLPIPPMSQGHYFGCRALLCNFRQCIRARAQACHRAK